MKRTLAFCALALLLFPAASKAALVNIPLPDGSYIENYMGSGLDVAWAAPCAPLAPSCGVIDLSFQSGFGWRLATLDEVAFLSANLVAQDFVFAGANVPLGGSDANGANFSGSPGGAAACAAPYFSSFHYHCDWSNGVGTGAGAVPWGFGQPGELSHAEAIAVRGAAVPEPAILALFGLSALMARRRSRQR
jgi:hypothetical protein